MTKEDLKQALEKVNIQHEIKMALCVGPMSEIVQRIEEAQIIIETKLQDALKGFVNDK